MVYSGFEMAGKLGATSAQPTLSSQAIRSQLDRILGHEIFSRSERLSRFLKYVIDETLAGRGAELKEPVLAAELYGKKVDSDSGDDSTVRVDARRLRDKLREYYGEHGARDTVIVTLPKGGYTPAFERNPLAPAPASMVAPQPILRRERLPDFAGTGAYLQLEPHSLVLRPGLHCGYREKTQRPTPGILFPYRCCRDRKVLRACRPTVTWWPSPGPDPRNSARLIFMSRPSAARSKTGLPLRRPRN